VPARRLEIARQHSITMNKRNMTPGAKLMLLAGILVGNILAVPVRAQAPDVARNSSTAVRPDYQPNRFSKRAELHYGVVWGIDSLRLKWAESGEVIRFSYRVLDADKARALNDKKSDPLLIDPRAGVKLVVPSLEKVGQLRQTGTPQAGTEYWMAFSNKGRLVKRGDRVSVVIGQFRADGLVVD
jgi:hypothetical protein